MTQNPCRVQIIANINGSQKSIVIPNTGYGMDRHANRWLARGASRVTVYVTSNSTGRLVSSQSYQAA